MNFSDRLSDLILGVVFCLFCGATVVGALDASLTAVKATREMQADYVNQELEHEIQKPSVDALRYVKGN